MRRERRASDQWAMIEALAWALLVTAWAFAVVHASRVRQTEAALERIEQRLEAGCLAREGGNDAE